MQKIGDCKVVFVEAPEGMSKHQIADQEKAIRAKLPEDWNVHVLRSGMRLAAPPREEARSAMPNIKIYRYNETAAGYIEPEDKSWILFIGLDGAPLFYPHRAPDGRVLCEGMGRHNVERQAPLEMAVTDGSERQELSGPGLRIIELLGHMAELASWLRTMCAQEEDVAREALAGVRAEIDRRRAECKANPTMSDHNAETMGGAACSCCGSPIVASARYDAHGQVLAWTATEPNPLAALRDEDMQPIGDLWDSLCKNGGFDRAPAALRQIAAELESVAAARLKERNDAGA